ncbi:MAG: hypothetical protein ACTSX4_01795 [Candidatus Helarchaeota archaeon]
MMLLAILICFIVGFINGYLGKRLYNKNKEINFWLISITIVPLWVFSVIAMFGWWPFYSIFNYSNGMSFLWNWPFFGQSIPAVTALFWFELIIIFFGYPLIYFWSRERCFQIFGRRPWQGGATWMLTMEKPPKTAKKGEKIIKGPLIDFKEMKLEAEQEEI